METQVFTSAPLSEVVGELARAIRSELDARQVPQQAPPEDLLTREETAELLSITLPTLREYTRKGLVQGYRIGPFVRYKRSEVIGGLQAMRNRKTSAR